MILSLTMKKCKKCGKLKSFDFFYKNIQKTDNLTSECKECVKERATMWSLNNKEHRKEYLKNYQKENRESIKRNRKEYLINWREKNRKYTTEYHVRKRKENPMLRLKHNLRNRLNLAFRCKSWKKGLGTELLLGCSFDEARKHIENNFYKDMTWGNYGKWHLDHMIPLSSAKNEEEMIKLCHYTNLQPLWASDNISKGNKIP